VTTHYSLGLGDRDRLNYALGGGFPAGAIVLLEGEDGFGKSVLAQRFARGCCAEGAHVGYVSTELTAPEFLAQMHSLSYDVVDDLLDERLLFLRADVDTQDRLAGDPVRRELLDGLLAPGLLWRADVVIVDAFDAILRNDGRFADIAETGDGSRAMQNVVTALSQATTDGTTVVLTLDPSGLDDETLRPLRAVADCYFRLSATKVGQERRKSIEVLRFVGMENRVNDTVGFSVQPNRGIVVESRTVA
jgi:flagellar protein FlaH